ncbi:MAG: HigA family addiction module antidote protein [Aliifodinibius sp.]|nr:HigA family addiction module antidote protein [Fodinibius sp.]NIV15734.1 HigA family addiction module antidote protein [Fodinibius sp.]NIY28083.1 HigA family addiction module antidote protein [Fodinibius sp.]
MVDRKPTHPGEILREDVIKPLGLTITEASKTLGVTRKTLSLLLNCKSSLSPEMAIRIGKATGTSPESWLYMQAKLDIWVANQHSDKIRSFDKKLLEAK